METIGNEWANEYWEAIIPPSYTKPNPKSTAYVKLAIKKAPNSNEFFRDMREEWIRTKYQQKLFADASKQPPSLPQQASPTIPTSRPETPTQGNNALPFSLLLTQTAEEPTTAKIPGIDFVGYGFFNFQDDPMRPVLRRQMRLFKNTFDEQKTAHVVLQHVPAHVKRRNMEYSVPDHFSVDTSSMRGHVVVSTKVFSTHEEYQKYAY